jgi:protein-S-isoprenylcysteine O-methyltransferase Ste14
VVSADPDTAGVIAPPPVIFAAALFAGWLIGWLVGPGGSPGFLRLPFRSWLGAILVLLSVALAGAAVVTMRRARTAVDPYRPSTALVIAGPYRYSRNPIYVGLMIFSLGVALLAGSIWMALLIIPAVVVLRLGVVAREEAYLGRKFGEEYQR